MDEDGAESSVRRDTAAASVTCALQPLERVLGELSDNVESVYVVEHEDEPDGLVEREVVATSTNLPLKLQPSMMFARSVRFAPAIDNISSPTDEYRFTVTDMSAICSWE